MLLFNKNIFYALISMGANFLAPLISIKILARVLGVDELGHFLVVQAIIVILCQFIDYGFSISGSRSIANSDGDVKKISVIFINIFFAKLLIGVVVLLCLLILISLNFVNLGIDVFIFSIVPAAIGNVFFSGWLFQGEGKFGVLAAVNFVSKFIYVALLIIFVNSPSDTLLALFFLGLSYVFMGVISFVCVSINKYFCFSLFDINTIFENLKNGWKTFLSMALLSMHMQFLIVLVSEVYGNSIAAATATADKIVRGISVAMAPISTTIFPVFSKMYFQGNIDKYQKTWRIIFIFLLCFGIFAGFIINFFAGEISEFFFKENTFYLNEILEILAFMPFFIGIGVACGSLGLIVKNEDRKYLIGIFVSEIIAAFIFLIVWVFNFNNAGAWAIIAAEASVAIMFVVFFRFDKYEK